MSHCALSENDHKFGKKNKKTTTKNGSQKRAKMNKIIILKRKKREKKEKKYTFPTVQLQIKSVILLTCYFAIRYSKQ